MKKRITIAAGLVALVFAFAGPVQADDAKKRAEADAMSAGTIDKLIAEDAGAKALYNQAYGQAVFEVIKVSFGITGGGGSGVAVNKETGERIYMNMGLGGLNLGFGGTGYRTVFLFETKEKFDSFVDKGWDAKASADAVAARKGASASASAASEFSDGIAFYTMDTAGAMLQADISGTKYWKSKLNDD